MEAVEAIIHALPAEADRIRQLYQHNLEFWAICNDYYDAILAVDRFVICNQTKSDEYRQLAVELLAEVVAMLGKGPS